MPASVLDFWFREIDPKLWWVHDPSFDEAIRSRFGALLERAAAASKWILYGNENNVCKRRCRII